MQSKNRLYPSGNHGQYRDEIYSLQILLSRTQAGPGRTVKQEQEEISPNHIQGPAKEWFPGCENFSGKVRQKW